MVPGRAPAFLVGDDLCGVVQLGNSAQVVIKAYDFVAGVEERTTSVAVDVLNVCGGQVVLCIIAPNFVTLLGQVRSCIPFTNLRHSAREKAKTPRATK